jgi:phage terminase large subunit GpA-like protein
MCPCVYCGFEQELRFSNVKFAHCRELLDDVYLESINPACGGHIHDSQRLTMMRRGRWVATHPERKGFAGFWLSRIYSPLASMASITKEFLVKKNNVLALRQFVNETLGEAWDPDREAKASTTQLYQRREHYAAEVPKGVGFLS